MAEIVHKVLAEASQWTWIHGTGPKYVEEVLIEGLTGTGDVAGMLAIEHMQTLEPDNYTLGAVRTFPPTDWAMPLVSATAKPVNGASTMRIRYEYIPTVERVADDSGDWVREYASTVQSVQTNYDISGNALTVTYTPSGGQEDTYLATVEALAPQASMRFSRRVTDANITQIHAAASVLVGSINVPWWVLATDEKQWLFSDVSARSHDGGSTYDVTYDFLHVSCVRQKTGGSLPTWDASIVYFDVANNRFPTDPLPTPVTKQIYPAYNFNVLGLLE